MYVINNASNLIAPACCAICRCGLHTDGVEYLIDTGFTEDFYGAFYICNRCVHEIIKIAGLEVVDGNPSQQRILDLERRIDGYEQRDGILHSNGVNLRVLCRGLFPDSSAAEREGEDSNISPRPQHRTSKSANGGRGTLLVRSTTGDDE